jgi:hypothetical protein
VERHQHPGRTASQSSTPGLHRLQELRRELPLRAMQFDEVQMVAANATCA